MPFHVTSRTVNNLNNARGLIIILLGNSAVQKRPETLILTDRKVQQCTPQHSVLFCFHILSRPYPVYMSRKIDINIIVL